MRSYEDYLLNKRVEWGKAFVEYDLDQRFRPYYESQERIKVRTCGLVLTGRVGVTTGWCPSFILMRAPRGCLAPMRGF